MTYFIGKSGQKYPYTLIATIIQNKAPHVVGKHIFEQLEAIELYDEMREGLTPYGLPYSFSEYSLITVRCHYEPRGDRGLEGFDLGNTYQAEINLIDPKGKKYARLYHSDHYYECCSMRHFPKFFSIVETVKNEAASSC